ncbi:MAG: AmmeMemoRadiSam system protein A [Desulfofustis sp.]|nr:AmmeMemoRadiSam system protein A [Desulfofustis sp.]
MKEITPEHGVSLLRLARETIARRLGAGSRSDRELLGDEAMQQQCGTFVTLKLAGQLRGCIGNLEPAGSLVDSVIRNAESAAFHDHRFAPLTLDELSRVRLEISILTPAVKLDYQDGGDLINRLRPGIDGVILQVDGTRATFLPQVWEQLPDPSEFLDHLCLKAGLPKSTWRHGQAEIFIYQVRSFSE